MNNWKELKENFVEVYKDKLKIELITYPIGIWIEGVAKGGYLKVKILHPCVDPCEEELVVFYDDYGRVSNPWIHYSEKVEADLDEFIGIKLSEQREREELEKLSSEERARLEKEKVSRILDSY